MLIVVPVLVVIAGVIIGCYTIAGSGIHSRPYGKRDAPGSDRFHGESPLDSPWQMRDWGRGTQSRRR